MGSALRAKLKGQLGQSLQTSFEKKDDSGRFRDIFRSDTKYEIQKWKCTEGTHKIDIIPFLAGEDHPYVKIGKLALGKPTHLIDHWVHMKVGPTEDQVVCPLRTLGTPCPICEHQQRLRTSDDPNDDEIDTLNPKHRVVYNIWCHDTQKEEQKGIQIWDASHFLMENEVIGLANRDKEELGKVIDFPDVDTGKTIKWKREGSGAFNTKYKYHEFLERKPIPDNLVEAAIPLDQIVQLHNYEEIEQMFFAGREEVPVEETTGSYVQEEGTDSTGTEETASTEETTSTEETSTFDPACEDASAGTQDLECPVDGGTFGVDLDQYKHCDKCDVVDDCDNENRRLKTETDKVSTERKVPAEKKVSAERKEPGDDKKPPRATINRRRVSK